MVFVALVMMTSMTSCTHRVIDSTTQLNVVRIENTSCLSRSEKEQLVYNKCIIHKAKYGKYTPKCKELISK